MRNRITAAIVIAVMTMGILPQLASGYEDQTLYAPSESFTLLDGPPVSGMMDHAGSLINLGQARSKYSTITGAGYTVAVLDTGVDPNHPALDGRYVGGWDYVNGDSNPDDDNGHGTHVAGIVASNNSTYMGLAPQAGVAALKVLNSGGGGSFSDIEDGLQWVINNRVTHNIVSVNMSLGTFDIYNTSMSSSISDELLTLKNAGVFIATASGNDWYAHSPNEGVSYPAADASAVAVGSVWSDDFGRVDWASGAIDYTTAADRVVSHANRSSTMLDILAPGALITSAAHNWETGNDFVQMGGTSMASPAVAGLALLIREAIVENWDPADWPTGAGWQNTILQIMQDTGVTVNDGDDENDNVANLGVDFSRIDVLAALDSVIFESVIMGDANRDGIVDAADFSILSANWLGTGKVWDDGDFNLDEIVDAADFSLLSANWQSGAAPLAEFQATLSQAPEPATMSLLALGGLALLRRRRK